MIFLTHTGDQALDADQRKIAEEKFNQAVDLIINNHRPMSREKMASLFDDDGYLGTAMRSMLSAAEDDFDIAA